MPRILESCCHSEWAMWASGLTQYKAAFCVPKMIGDSDRVVIKNNTKLKDGLYHFREKEVMYCS